MTLGDGNGQLQKPAPLFLLLTNDGRTRKLLDKDTISSLTTKRLNEEHIVGTHDCLTGTRSGYDAYSNYYLRQMILLIIKVFDSIKFRFSKGLDR